MQASAPAKPPIGVVFDAALGQRPDDVLALALLYGFDGKNEIRAVSISSTKSNLKSAALAEAVARFYTMLAWGEFTRFARVPPIGLSLQGKLPEDTPMLDGVFAKKDAEGKPLYPHEIHQLNDTAEAAALIRNAFTAQHDENCVVALAGPATNLAEVLDLRGAKELIAQKVAFLSMAGGAFPDGGPEFNIKTDIAAARKVLAEWPTPVIMAGHEIGESVLYPGSSIEQDYAWAENHPVADAYRAYQAMPYDAPTWNMAAVLHAAKPDGGYFKLSEPGTVEVLDSGATQFTPSPDGRHRYLILDPDQKERIVKTYTEYASAKPQPRQPRRRPQAEKPKPEEKKQPEAKPPAS
jgi:inosine-uridine nucleoside N-ribohydrolase